MDSKFMWEELNPKETNEQMFKDIVEDSCDMIFTVGKHGRITYLSPAVHRFLQYTPEELTGKPYAIIIAESDLPRVTQLIIGLMEGKAIGIAQIELKRKDGSHIPVEINTSPKYENGKFIALQGVARDITERKWTEDALRESEEKYRKLVESANDLMFIEDLERNFLFTNNACEKTFGYSSLEIQPMNMADFIHSDHVKKMENLFAKVIQGKRMEDVEIKCRTKDGSYIDILLNAAPIFDSSEKVIGFSGIGRNITQRKRIEEELIRIRAAIEGASDAVGMADPRGHHFYQNSAFTTLFQYTVEEFEAAGGLAAIYADKNIANKVLKEIMNGRDWTGDVEMISKSGNSFPVFLRASVIKNDAGEIIGLISVHTDISERKRFETQFQQAQKMKALSTLAGGIAHQFNNALAGIIGNIELLSMDFVDKEKISKYIEPVKNSIVRMAILTNQLLAYAKGGKYKLKEISLSQFVEETLPLIRHKIDSTIRVETDLPRAALNVSCDRTQMQMVLLSVVTNAAEAIEGSGRIKIIVRNKEVGPNLAKKYAGLKPGRYVCLVVKDNGKGMERETMNRIFEPFFTTNFQGRGLGMAAVYGIIKNHQGWIGVKSKPNKGAVVIIFLPVSGDGKETFPQPQKKISLQKGTVLLIEDEEMLITVCQAMLEKLGFHVLPAKTGGDAVSIANSFRGHIDLALLDVNLPDIGGKETYFLLKKARPDLKVIVSSGYSIDGPVKKILEAGAQGFLQKPFTFASLYAKLMEAADRRTSRRCKAKRKITVTPLPDISEKGELIEISKGGLSFIYNNGISPLTSFSELEMQVTTDNYHFSPIPCKLISESALAGDSLPNSRAIRRYGVQFEALTSGQTGQLEQFIQSYTIAAGAEAISPQ